MRVEVAGLHIDIGAAPIVSDATLIVTPGEVVGLIGPNGSGKSTLLRAMYRAPHKRPMERDDRQDRRLVVEALAQVGMAGKGGRVFATLSGGEKQRILLARALAQQSQLLLLDEPTNHLDVCAQFELLALIRRLGMTTLAALHDLNLAAAFCDRLYVLAGGRVVAQGRVAEVLTPALLAEVFGVTAHCGPHPVTGHFHVAYLPPPELNGHPPPRSALAYGG